jgi:hypothetical protein
MSRVIVIRAWPMIRLTWAMSRPRSTIGWPAKVWRRSWKRKAGQPSPFRWAESAARLSTRWATLRCPSGVLREVAKTQSVRAANGEACLWAAGRWESCSTSGTSRTEAGVFGATRRAGWSRCARDSCALTRITPVAKLTERRVVAGPQLAALGIHAPSFRSGSEVGQDAAPKGQRRVPLLLHRSYGFGAGPGAFASRWGHLLMWAATVAPLRWECEPKSPRIGGNPLQSAGFEPLVAQMERDARGSGAIHENAEAPDVQGLPHSGASRTRTGDLLGAIQALRFGQKCLFAGT